MDGGIQEPIQLKIAEGDANLERLDRFLVQKLPEISRSRIQNWVKDGLVQVNGQTAKPKTPLKPGDEILITMPGEASAELKAEAIPLEVLFEDAHFLVVNKPEGLVVHPGAGVTEGTLVNALLAHCQGQLSSIGEADRPGIVHRLDKDTSGCIAVAKDNPTHEKLASAFAGRELRKEYLCIVAGQVKPDEGTIENHIGRNPGNRQKMAVVDSNSGRRAHTDFQVLGRASDYSAVLCRIHTGRTHQIRVHMAYTLGHPILGDPIYGKGTLKHADATRLMLHAWRLGLTHPQTGEELGFEAPLPPVMADLLSRTQA